MHALLSAARIAAHSRPGFWPGRTLVEYFDDALARDPDKIAITGRNSSTGDVTTLSYPQLHRLVERMAIGLVQLGVARGEVVSCQLPNWWQFVALHLACIRIGAITNPLMPIFRQRELGYMLGFAESRILVIPRHFRGFDYPAMVDELRAALPRLAHVLVVGDTRPDSFEAALLQPRLEQEPGAQALLAGRQSAPNDIVQLLYTSGTTGEPKGVLHTSNTLISIIQCYAKRLGLDQSTVILMASPLAHQAGFMYGAMMAPLLGGKLVLQDIWQPDEAAALIEAERVSYSMGSTPFLADLADAPALTRHDISSLRTFVSSGAPIPRVLVERAVERLRCAVISAWGMSETGSVTTTCPDDPPEKIFGTDGVALPGMEVRVVAECGSPRPVDTEGNLQCRGIGNFVAYFRRPEISAGDAEGWFDTGDLATMDADGYIRITGRSKDIIIRGGENIPVIEIEELVYRHPAVQSAAIVAMPDARLGERGCLFVVLQPGATLSFDEMVDYLDRNHVAKHYFPERLEILPELPRTASGKIQKYVLRERARAFAAGGN
jgi:cyclohexanecarboxylate-CoA ligase